MLKGEGGGDEMQQFQRIQRRIIMMKNCKVRVWHAAVSLQFSCAQCCAHCCPGLNLTVIVNAGIAEMMIEA